MRARIGEDVPLPSVAESQKVLAEKMKPAIKRHVAESWDRFRAQSMRLGEAKAAMTIAHREGRRALDDRLNAEWTAECRARAASLPRGLRGLWRRITGDYQKQRALLEAEAERSRFRQAQERQALVDKQHRERAALQRQFKELRSHQAQQLVTLRAEIGRFFSLSRGLEASAAAGRARSASTGLKLSR